MIRRTIYTGLLSIAALAMTASLALAQRPHQQAVLGRQGERRHRHALGEGRQGTC